MAHAGSAAGQWRRGVICLLAAWSCLSTYALAGPTARISDSGESVELTMPGEGGGSAETIPLYRSGEVRYFSAGVGIEERSAEYPAFPLKLIFTAGGRPYITGVAVTVRDTGGSLIVAISAEQITGPWLFLDLPDGSYHIAASMEGQTEHANNVKVERGTPKVLYLRWDREPGRP